MPVPIYIPGHRERDKQEWGGLPKATAYCQQLDSNLRPCDRKPYALSCMPAKPLPIPSLKFWSQEPSSRGLIISSVLTFDQWRPKSTDLWRTNTNIHLKFSVEKPCPSQFYDGKANSISFITIDLSPMRSKNKISFWNNTRPKCHNEVDVDVSNPFLLIVWWGNFCMQQLTRTDTVGHRWQSCCIHPAQEQKRATVAS